MFKLRKLRKILNQYIDRFVTLLVTVFSLETVF